MRRIRQYKWLLFLLGGVLAVLAVPAFSYLSELTTPGPQQDRWDFSSAGFAVQWQINPAIGSNISNNGTVSVTQVIQAAFNTWITAPNVTMPITEGTQSNKTAAAFDGINLICFVCTGDFSKEASTLAVTISTSANAVGQATMHGSNSNFVGQILDADILFSPSVALSTTGGNNCGQSGGQCDLQTIATHEIGHFLGLDHSGVVAAMMFPFAPDCRQTLSWDDVAGLANIPGYTAATPVVSTGSISGTVTFAGANTPVFGAHVYAGSTTTADPYTLVFGNASTCGAAGTTIRKSSVGAMTLPNGTYTITGLPADSYIITAEPLDLPVTNDDVSGYPSAEGQSAVQTNFTTRWH
jgi:hypothetical protein